MSDEYRVTTKTAAATMDAAEAILIERGLETRSRSPRHLSMSFPDADPSIERWGGNVQLELDPVGLFLTLNGIGGPYEFAERLQEALALAGVVASIEEA